MTNSLRGFAVLLLLLSFCLVPAGCGSSEFPEALPGQSDQDVPFRFAVFGDVQIGPVAWQETRDKNPSSANLPQLERTYLDLVALTPRPSLLFVLGDLVLGEVVITGARAEGEVLREQLDAWQAFYRSLPVAALIPQVPLAGNHELALFKVPDYKIEATPTLAQVWVDWLTREGYDRFAGDGPSPAPPNLDRLVRDESKLTYSFDVNGVHFIVINSDTVSEETDDEGIPLQGWIPIHWIEEDLRRAQSDSTVSSIIVMSHRPIEAFPWWDGALDNRIIIDTEAFPFGSRLAQAMRENDKTRLFIASHFHAWDILKLDDQTGCWQLCSGNGGAPPTDSWQPDGGQFFGFCVIDVYAGGKVVIESYGRPLPPEPQEFYEAQPVAPEPATLRHVLVLEP